MKTFGGFGQVLTNVCLVAWLSLAKFGILNGGQKEGRRSRPEAIALSTVNGALGATHEYTVRRVRIGLGSCGHAVR